MSSFGERAERIRVAADARYRDEQQEQFPLLPVGEPEEHVRVFADGLVDVELARLLSLDGGVGVEGDAGGISHAVAVDDGGGGSQFGYVALDVFYHILGKICPAKLVILSELA